MGGEAKNQQSALKNEELNLRRGPCGETEALYRHESEINEINLFLFQFLFL